MADKIWEFNLEASNKPLHRITKDYKGRPEWDWRERAQHASLGGHQRSISKASSQLVAGQQPMKSLHLGKRTAGYILEVISASYRWQAHSQ